jgi:YfiH family protein
MMTAGSDAVIRPDWLAPPNVHAFVTTRHLPGNSQPPYDAFNLGLRSGDDEAVVRANRALLERALKLPASPRWLHQVHGDRSLRLTEELFDGEQMADAAFTTQPNIVLAILTADCLPVLVAARDGSEIAAIHAGWRGLAAGILESTITRLRARTDQLLVWLGPAIGAASYEVGDEVRTTFVATSDEAALAFTATLPGRWRCDLYELARQKLRAIGIEAISGGDFDTLNDARFYSYRRDGVRSGRFASVIWRD